MNKSCASYFAKTPWQLIRDAADKGKGLRLTAHEVARLAQDDAIQHLAANDDEDDMIECSECKRPVGKHKRKPR